MSFDYRMDWPFLNKHAMNIFKFWKRKPKYPKVNYLDKVTFNELGLAQFDDCANPEKVKAFNSRHVFQVVRIDKDGEDEGNTKLRLHCGTFLRLKWAKVLPKDTPIRC